MMVDEWHRYQYIRRKVREREKGKKREIKWAARDCLCGLLPTAPQGQTKKKFASETLEIANNSADLLPLPLLNSF